MNETLIRIQTDEHGQFEIFVDELPTVAGAFDRLTGEPKIQDVDFSRGELSTELIYELSEFALTR